MIGFLKVRHENIHVTRDITLKLLLVVAIQSQVGEILKDILFIYKNFFENAHQIEINFDTKK